MPETADDITIRPYLPDDEEAWLRCRVLSFLHTQYFDDVKTERTVFDRPSLCSVAVLGEAAGGTVVGVLDVEIDGTAATIDTVAVHPDHARRGVATRLLEAAVPHLVSRGVTSLDAWTREDEPANQWYLDRGFRENFRYLHVHAQDTDPAGTGFSPLPDLGTPLSVFAHASIEHEASLRARHRRVHQCRQYLMTLAQEPTPSRPAAR